MHYKVEHFVKRDRWSDTYDRNRLERECQLLGEAFVNLVQTLEKVAPDSGILKSPDVSYRVKLMRAVEDKERKAAEKKRADAKARKEALSKLTHAEKVAFGLVKE